MGSACDRCAVAHQCGARRGCSATPFEARRPAKCPTRLDRKSTRLNSSHSQISYAVFCLKKKNSHPHTHTRSSTRATTVMQRPKHAILGARATDSTCNTHNTETAVRITPDARQFEDRDQQ